MLRVRSQHVGWEAMLKGLKKCVRAAPSKGWKEVLRARVLKT